METVIRSCPVCTRSYKANPSRLKFGRQTTCSRACSYAIRAAAISRSTVFSCAVCGKTVHKSPSQVRGKHGSVFCSKECHYAGRSTGATKRTVTKPYVYTPEGKAALIASSLKPKGQRRFHPTICSHCGKTFDDPRDGRQRKSGEAFCSLACCNTYRTGSNNPAWRGGYDRYYGPSWRAARHAARIRDSFRCRRCGKKSKRAPDVHHIKSFNTFASHEEANVITNLVCVCHSCHMLVEWRGIDFAL